ncbi:MAG: hypothetical protein HKN31_00700 [Pricia sp.]|nr:hypothetical protein [Pricia sp.]
MNDGKFEVLVFKKLDLINILKTLKGEVELDSDFVDVVQTTEVDIEAEKPIDFQVDGEYYGRVQKLHAHIIPNAIKIAVGT